MLFFPVLNAYKMMAKSMALSENLSITESKKAPIGFALLSLLANDPSRASKREKNIKSEAPSIQF